MYCMASARQNTEHREIFWTLISTSVIVIVSAGVNACTCADVGPSAHTSVSASTSASPCVSFFK